MFKAVKWAYKPEQVPRGIEPVYIEQTRQRDGSIKYAIRQHGACYNKENEWEFEPIPSSRDDEFISRCRYDSLLEAEAVVAYKIVHPAGRMREYVKNK